MRRLFALLVVSGCDLYADDTACTAQSVRNPQTGECACDAPDPTQEWGACSSSCDDLDARSCAAASGCHAVYINSLHDDGPPSFGGCHAVASSAPIHGSCANRSAYECARHDDCYAIYNIVDGGLSFAICAGEPQL